MSRHSLLEKLTHLSAAQLDEVDRFVDRLHCSEGTMAIQLLTAMSERAFGAIWNNAEDDVYDSL